MGRYLSHRLAAIAPTILAASLLVFLVMRVLPGDVVMVILAGAPHSLEVRESLREELGLDVSLPLQYGRWLWSMVSGEFGGRSLESREQIRSMVLRQFPVTLLLAFYAVTFSVLVSVPLGVVSAVWRNRWPDYLVRTVTLGGLSVPAVWTALLVLLGLLRLFRWSPPILYAGPVEDLAVHIQMMIWPCLILAWELSSHLVRVTRASLLEILDQDYIVSARGRGVPEVSLILRHGLPGALVPVITMIGLQFGTLLGGALVLETIFGLPGIGRGLVHAALSRDYPVVQSVATILVLLYLVVNLVVDSAYGLIDPRISRNRSAT